jgi:hypothetical protein
MTAEHAVSRFAEKAPGGEFHFEWEPMQEERFNTICLLVGIGLGCYTFIEFFKMMV